MTCSDKNKLLQEHFTQSLHSVMHSTVQCSEWIEAPPSKYSYTNHKCQFNFISNFILAALSPPDRLGTLYTV